MTFEVIDAHHHLWDLSVRDQDWISGADLAPLRRDFLPADFEREAARAGVTGSVVVQTVSDPQETPELLAIAAGSPVIAGVVGWTDLTAPDVADSLDRLRASPGGDLLVGIRHQVQSEPDLDWLTRPEVLRGLSAVADAQLVYDLVITPNQLPAAARAAAAVPGLTFVLNHLGKPPIASGPLAPWADGLGALAALPNTVCKLSGLLTEADWHAWTQSDLSPCADFALEVFGPDRLMFGSDWPVSTLAASYGTGLDTTAELVAGLSPTERQLVFAGTARRCYGLPAQS
jgi:L-fuconolactonase